jgi:hypothetical protein
MGNNIGIAVYICIYWQLRLRRRLQLLQTTGFCLGVVLDETSVLQ